MALMSVSFGWDMERDGEVGMRGSDSEGGGGSRGLFWTVGRSSRRWMRRMLVCRLVVSVTRTSSLAWRSDVIREVCAGCGGGVRTNPPFLEYLDREVTTWRYGVEAFSKMN